MKDVVANFIRARRIDSFQKLRFLLYLHQHPDLTETRQGFARRLYLGNCPLMDRMISDLCQNGLIDCVGDGFRLHNAPEIKLYLQRLTQAFEDPLARQKILAQIRQGEGYRRYGQDQYELN